MIFLKGLLWRILQLNFTLKGMLMDPFFFSFF